MTAALKVVVVVTGDPVLGEDASYSFPDDYDVLVAGDSRDALRIMASRPPSLAIVDIQTGNAGGFNLAREMQATPELRDVPILMLLERHQDSWLASQAGAKRWRTKPVDGWQLASEASALIP